MKLKPEGIFLAGVLLHPQQLIDMWKMEVKARAELEKQVAALKADAKFVYDDCWMRADLSADGKVPISYSAWMKICRMAQESE